MGIDISKMPRLGFGLMRLPEKDGEIEMQEVCRMVDLYMEAGLNYFDTAYVYHSGKSECAAGEALVKRYPRDAYYIATKLPGWELHEKADRDRILDEQLKRAGLTYYDFYLLHSIEEGNIEKYESLDTFRWGLEKKAEGKIRHFGFSFHGSPELLESVLDAHPEVEFVQIQLNYADWNNPVVQSGKLYRILADRQIPIIVMEPVKGGTLANIRPDLMDIFRKVKPEASAASWALRYVASLPGVMTILSGMSNEAQMKDNLHTFSAFEALSDEEQAAVAEVRRIMLDIPQIGCTSCRYCCDGCPQSISIPDVFSSVNTMTLYGDEFRPKAYYRGLVSTGKGRAGDCIACGQCESVCPQHLPIIELLKEASAKLDA